jgi:hypothetical protein
MTLTAFGLFKIICKATAEIDKKQTAMIFNIEIICYAGERERL